MGPECPNPAGTTSGPGLGPGTRDTALLAMLTLSSEATHVPSQAEQTQPLSLQRGLRPPLSSKTQNLLSSLRPRGQSTGLAWQAWPLSTNKGEDNEERKSKLSQERRKQVQERGHRRRESVCIAPRVDEQSFQTRGQARALMQVTSQAQYGGSTKKSNTGLTCYPPIPLLGI